MEVDPKSFINQFNEELEHGMSGYKLYNIRKELGINNCPSFTKELYKYCYIWGNPGANPGAVLKESKLGREIEETVLKGIDVVCFKGCCHKLRPRTINEIRNKHKVINVDIEENETV